MMSSGPVAFFDFICFTTFSITIASSQAAAYDETLLGSQDYIITERQVLLQVGRCGGGGRAERAESSGIA